MRRRDYALAFLLLPVIWTAVGLAVGTHFLTRYAYPFIPISAVVISLALYEVGRGRSSDSDSQQTPADPRQDQLAGRERYFHNGPSRADSGQRHTAPWLPA